MIKWNGTAVPNNEMINSLYLNTNLTNEEMIALIDNVELKDIVIDENSMKAYPLINNSTFGASLIISIVNYEGIDVYGLALIFSNGYQTNVWNSMTGWNQEGIVYFEQGIGANLPIMNEIDKSEYFNHYQNDKLSSLLSITPFVAKQIITDLPTFLTNIGNAIRKKKDTTEKINAQDFEGEIMSISGDSAQIVQPEVIDTTVAVPNTGTINKICFNINLSNEEVVEIINNANLNFVDNKYYVVVTSGEETLTGEIHKVEDVVNGYMISMLDWVPLWISKELADNGNFVDYGWITQNKYESGILPANGIFPISEAVGVLPTHNGQTVGEQNEALKRLVYCDGTIYETGNMEVVKELSGQYLAETQTITPEKSTTYNILDMIGEKVETKKEGTLLVSNPDTLVEKIYFNTDLSVYEVVDVLKNLNYINNPAIFEAPFYIAYANADLSRCIAIIGASGMYAIAEGNFGTGDFIPIFSSMEEGDMAAGWNIQSKEYQIGLTGLNFADMLQLAIGDQNDKLTSLLSMNKDFELKEIKTKVFPKNININLTKVPIPEGYIKPEGTLNINSNGHYNVEQYAYVSASLKIPEGYVKPSGTKNITENGFYNIASYENVSVNTIALPIYGAHGETPKVITPTTEVQQILPPEGYDGFSILFVRPVDSTIDSNIQPENIKEGVSILGVQGTLQAGGGGGYEGDYKTILFNNGWVETFTIPEDIVSVPSHCFYGRYVREIVIHDKVEVLGYAAFSYSYIKKLVIPNNVVSIGQRLCDTCQQLTDVTLPSNMTTIPDGMFNWCKNLSAITIPDGVTSIGYTSFADCSSLTSIIIPNSVTIIDQNAFQNCSGLKNIVLSNNLTKIAYGAFTKCSSLESIEISSNIITIEGMTFDNCSALKSVILPNSLKTISYQAFNKCTSLTSIIIPESVTSIQNFALAIGNETDKATITMLSTTPPTITSSSFNKNCLNKIIVPVGCGNAYKSATNWSSLADYIEEASE